MKRLREEDGFSMPVVIWMLATMVLLLGGISVDLWRVIGEYRAVAGIVDGASIAGASAIDVDFLRNNPGTTPVLDRNLAFDRACTYILENSEFTSCADADLAITPTDMDVSVTMTRDVDLTLLQGLAAFSDTADTSAIRVTAQGVASVLRGLP